MVLDDSYYINLAYQEALEAHRLGFSPVGCVIVDNETGAVLESAYSQRSPGNIYHAEYLALQKFNQGEYSKNVTLYATLEPCIMCMGTAIVSRIKNIVWLMSDLWAGSAQVFNYESEYLSSRKLTLIQVHNPKLLNEYAQLWIDYLTRTGANQMIKKLVNRSKQMKVIVFTNDRYSHALKGFSYLFNKYWSSLQPITAVGCSEKPNFLPDNFESIPKCTQDKLKWTTGLANYLRSITDSHLVILLEDYWLCRGVNHQAVETLHEFCVSHPQILRMDLTDDRQYNGHAIDFEYVPYYGYNDIVWTPPDSPYQSSLQAGIWNRKLLLEVLHEGESSWQFEIGKTGENIRNRSDLWVLGTRQRPIRYANVFKGGDVSKMNLEGLTNQDIEELKGIGAIP